MRRVTEKPNNQFPSCGAMEAAMRKVDSSWRQVVPGRFRATLAALFALLLAAGAGAQVWQVGEQGLVATTGPQDGGQFGQDLASGDFNGDGYRDLAVGAPFWDGPVTNGGRVQIHFGGSAGLMPPLASFSGSQSQMRLGDAVAAGDFDGDGDDELVVGAPGYDSGAIVDSGRLFVFDYSTSTGWSTDFFDQGAGGMPGTAEADDLFGEVVAVGDFNDDGRDDLAVGAPHEDGLFANSGGVLVLYGSATGLTSAGAEYILQTTIAGPEQAGAGMGFALAAGDFDGDDLFYDLAVGAPSFDLGAVANAGQVAVLRGSSGGLSTTGISLLTDASFGGVLEAGDDFGWALAAADFSRTATCWFAFSCRTDLAIGMPGQTISGQTNAGRVVVALGEGGAQQFTQGTLVPAASGPETDDRFGSVLLSEWVTSAALDGPSAGFPGADDLVIGVPGEAWVSTSYQGIVHLVFGSSTGLNSTPGQFRLADAGLSAAPAAAFDNFGNALALGRFNGGDYVDLAIGVLGRDAGAIENNGLVQVMFGALFADGFESGSSGNWSGVAPLADWSPLAVAEDEAAGAF